MRPRATRAKNRRWSQWRNRERDGGKISSRSRCSSEGKTKGRSGSTFRSFPSHACIFLANVHAQRILQRISRFFVAGLVPRDDVLGGRYSRESAKMHCTTYLQCFSKRIRKSFRMTNLKQFLLLSGDGKKEIKIVKWKDNIKVKKWNL